MHIWAPPSKILRRVDRIQGTVSWDTETSGLFADDGARVSTVSMAWADWAGDWAGWGGVNWGLEDVYSPDDEGNAAEPVPIVSVAWPFDQGVQGKPEDTGQDTLFGSEWENLTSYEWRALLELLAKCGDGLIAQNAKFDLEKMRYGVRRWPGVGHNLRDRVKWDTQLVSKVLWPTEGTTSLKPTAERLWGVDSGDESRVVKEYLRRNKLPAGRWDLMPWDIIGDYADQDARLTKRLELRQIDDIGRGGLLYAAKDHIGGDGSWLVGRDLEVMKVLDREEERGVPYDTVGSLDAATECIQIMHKIGARLPFEPTLNAAKDYYFGDKVNSRGNAGLNLIPLKMTDAGAVSMTEEVVVQMGLKEYPWVNEWRDYKKVSTAQSMWYSAYAAAIGQDGRLRTHFRQAAKANGDAGGTRSGRFSVERVNLQAIPHDYRLEDFEILTGIPTPRQLIARGVPQGWAIYEIDLAQAELRVAAMFARCKPMLDLIVAGRDLHTATCADLFGYGPEHPAFAKYRQVAKRGNFSLIFGIGWSRLQADIAKQTGIYLGDAETQRLHKDWNRLYPQYGVAIDKHSRVVERRQEVHGHGWVDLVNGNRRWFARYEDTHKAFNQRVQPNLAEFGLEWMLQSDEYLRSTGLQEQADTEGIGGAGLILTIHDSQVILVPDTDAGRKQIDQCADFARGLWRAMFPDVPGDADIKRWK